MDLLARPFGLEELSYSPDVFFEHPPEAVLLPVLPVASKSSLCQVRWRSRFGTRPTSGLNPTRGIYTRLDHHGHRRASRSDKHWSNVQATVFLRRPRSWDKGHRIELTDWAVEE